MIWISYTIRNKTAGTFQLVSVIAGAGSGVTPNAVVEATNVYTGVHDNAVHICTHCSAQLVLSVGFDDVQTPTQYVTHAVNVCDIVREIADVTAILQLSSNKVVGTQATSEYTRNFMLPAHAVVSRCIDCIVTFCDGLIGNNNSLLVTVAVTQGE